VRESSYMHSFAMTENYIIFIEFPFVLRSLLDFVFSPRPIFDEYLWLPQRGTRFLAFHKKDGSLKTWEAPAAFAMHQINAFEQNGDIFIDLVGYAESNNLMSLFLDQLLRNGGGDAPLGQCWRYHLSRGRTRATMTPLVQDEAEMPRINWQFSGMRPYRHAYLQGRRTDPPWRDDFYNRLYKLDAMSAKVVGSWHEDHCYPGEPVFVPRPGAAQEDDGVVLSVILDGRQRESFLLVLDGQSFAERARAHLGYVLPFGFHCQFSPERGS
jgi:beta,beta-carotene 9',10'-dioxygenase